MNKIKSFKPRKAQSQVSQEFFNNTKNSTVKAKIQVSSTRTIIENQLTNSDDNHDSPNNNENSESSTRFEDKNSNLFILSFDNSSTSKAANEKVGPNFIDSTISITQNEPDETIVEKQLKDSVDSFIKNTSDFYFLRAQELLECDDSSSYELAVKTIKDAKRNAESSWVLIGIAAYRVWKNTPALSGGAGNVAAADEGRMNALEKLAIDCTQKNSRVKARTLYDYVRRIRLLLEEPLEESKGYDEETIRLKRTVLMQKLLTVPGSFARAAVATTKPLEALEIACEERAAAAKGKSFTCSDFNTSIEHLKKDANTVGNQNVAGNCSGFEQILASQISSEAKRVKLNPEQVRGLYMSFLQAMLSTVQNMGVER